MEDISSELAFLLADCTRLYSTNLDRRLRSAGMTLSRSQWRVIAYLYRQDGITQTELADMLGIEKAPIGTLLEKLEKIQLIDRRCDSEDKRAKRVYITDAGRKMMPLIREHADLLKTLVTEDISDQEMMLLIKLLQKIKVRLLNEKEQSQTVLGAV
jgi:MarR family transcriptional regulator, transcriptional regulator for hemolysin